MILHIRAGAPCAGIKGGRAKSIRSDRLRSIGMRISTAAVVTPLIILAASSAFADVIELRSGQRVEGMLRQATPASVSVEVGGQTITFTGDKVRAIYFGAAPTPKTEKTQVPHHPPDRFVAWETLLLPGRTRATISQRGVHDSRDECQKYAAHMTESMKGARKQYNASIFYECLPVGVQPTQP